MISKVDWAILKKRNALYGFCALWIMIFHIEKQVGIPWHIPFITPFIQMGNAGVDIFMLLSGYCLCLSYVKTPDWLNFYKKRVARVVLPYLIIAVPFYLWKNIFQHPLPSGDINVLGFIADITGYSFWKNGTQTSWFVAAIVMFYLLFPFIYRIIEKGKWFSLFVLLLLYPIIIATQNCGFSIAVSRFPAFCLGIVMAYYGIVPKENWTTTLLSMVYILFFMGLFPIKYVIRDLELSLTYLWMFYITMIIPMLYILYCLFEKIRLGEAFLSFVGKYSLEIYLIHVMILNASKWSGFTAIAGYWMYLIIPITTIPLSVLASLLAKQIKF